MRILTSEEIREGLNKNWRWRGVAERVAARKATRELEKDGHNLRLERWALTFIAPPRKNRPELPLLTASLADSSEVNWPEVVHAYIESGGTRDKALQFLSSLQTALLHLSGHIVLAIDMKLGRALREIEKMADLLYKFVLCGRSEH